MTLIIKQTNPIRKERYSKNNWNFIYKKSDNVITAVGRQKYFCIGMVDIINSTKTVALLQQDMVPKYYEIFLNNMAKPVNYHQGKILKIMGDSLLFYFSDIYHNDHNLDFLNPIECIFSMMEMHKKLNQILKKYHLPQIDFRVSLDYGNVTIMKTRDGLIDFVGPAINSCAKINEFAPVNGTIIGGDLYEKIRHSHKYGFKNAGCLSIGLKKSYPTFSPYRKTYDPFLISGEDC